MKKDLLILALAASTATALLFCLISLRVAGDHQARAEKLEQDLYVTELKKDYFEWRESNAIGHMPGADFDRQAEYDALNNQR